MVAGADGLRVDDGVLFLRDERLDDLRPRQGTLDVGLGAREGGPGISRADMDLVTELGELRDRGPSAATRTENSDFRGFLRFCTFMTSAAIARVLRLLSLLQTRRGWSGADLEEELRAQGLAARRWQPPSARAIATGSAPPRSRCSPSSGLPGPVSTHATAVLGQGFDVPVQPWAWGELSGGRAAFTGAGSEGCGLSAPHSLVGGLDVAIAGYRRRQEPGRTNAGQSTGSQPACHTGRRQPRREGTFSRSHRSHEEGRDPPPEPSADQIDA
ncbi:hypothetical protein GCM10022233_57700 [Streptomyces shaanxiensis]|uniref:Uncharacterized protein n=1 Tax=Streptomyces shaanxiensis TaxID=653357 RepID=A0ABP7VRT7_9ACTN